MKRQKIKLLAQDCVENLSSRGDNFLLDLYRILIDSSLQKSSFAELQTALFGLKFSSKSRYEALIKDLSYRVDLFSDNINSGVIFLIKIALLSGCNFSALCVYVAKIIKNILKFSVVQIVHAGNLTQDEITDIEAEVLAFCGLKNIIFYKENPAIIDGVVIFVDNKKIDYSLASKIDNVVSFLKN